MSDRSTRTNRSARAGFSLIEIAVATAVVGIGLTALLVAVGSNTRVNDAGAKLTQAVFLAQEIREWTLTLPFCDPQTPGNPPGRDGSSPQDFVDDLDDFHDQGEGTTYNPPRNGRGVAITQLTGWYQRITLTWQDPNDLAATLDPGGSDIINVHVTVGHNLKDIVTTSWLVARGQNP